MERPLYCVYNQTSECFLSLGVTVGGNTLDRLLAFWSGSARRYDEGGWILRPKRIDTLRFLSSTDLIFLDENQRVISAIESFSRFQMMQAESNAASLLTLPVHTVDSSQTRPGHQLVICVAGEMDFRLRNKPELNRCDLFAPCAEFGVGGEPGAISARKTAREQHGAKKKNVHRLVAYDSKNGALDVQGVKGLSANGLYLVTGERWPLGTQVTMTLQKTDGATEDLTGPIKVQLRVMRWGTDGVGLEFIQPEAEESALMAMTVF